MTSPGRSRLHKHRLQRKTSMNILLLTIGPLIGERERERERTNERTNVKLVNKFVGLITKTAKLSPHC